VTTAIQTKGLTKDYGAGHGIFDLDLTVEEGEVFGYLGPNGAGKTTTISILTTTLSPTSGGATIDGRDIAELLRKSHTPVLVVATVVVFVTGVDLLLLGIGSPMLAVPAQVILQGYDVVALLVAGGRIGLHGEDREHVLRVPSQPVKRRDQ